MGTNIKNKKGISLIVLVITICIMIILAIAVILAVSSNGIIEKSNIAKAKSDLSNLQEAVSLKAAERMMNDLNITNRYKLSEWGINNDDYEDRVLIEKGKILVKRIEKADAIEKAAEELGILGVLVNNKIENATGANLINYRVYGNSVQNGTPTPQAPAEIESLGDRTKNLFNINADIESNHTTMKAIVSGNQVTTTSSSGSWIYFLFNFVETSQQKQFTLSYNLVQGRARIGIRLYDINKELIDDSSITIQNLKYNQVYNGYYSDLTDVTFTLPQEVKYIRTFLVGMANDTIDDKNIYSDIQLEEGSSATSYEPYGYKIPVKVSGKNLVDSEKFYSICKNIYNGTERIEYNGIDCVQTKTSYLYDNWTGTKFSEFITDWEENTRYTLTMDVSAINVTSTFGVGFIYSDGTRNTNRCDITTLNDFQHIELTSAENKSVVGIAFSYANDMTININMDTFQIEEGTAATTYEPYVSPITTNIYLDEPLRKIGDAADYIDFKEQKIVRKVGAAKLDTSLTWVDYTSQVDGYYKAYTTDLKIGSDSSYESASFAKSSHFSVFGVYGRAESICFTEYATYISISSSKASSVSSFKEWLTNNNIDIIYKLRKPTETSITLPDISTFKGTTTISVSSSNGVEASNIEVEY